MTRAAAPQSPIFRVIGLTWFTVSVFGLMMIVLMDVLERSSNNEALGFVSIFLGLPALIEAGLAFWLLRTQDRTAQRVLTILLAIPPVLLLLSEPLLVLVIIAATASALYAASRRSR